MALEKTVTNNILKYLNGLPNCVAEKVSGNVGQAGRADISGCYRGRAFRIEVKTSDNNNKPTAKQLLDLSYWGKAGAVAIVAYSVNDVRYIFSGADMVSCKICNGYIDRVEICPVRYCRWRGEVVKGVI